MDAYPYIEWIRINDSRYVKWIHENVRPPLPRIEDEIADLVEKYVREKVKRLNGVFRLNPERRILWVEFGHVGGSTPYETDVVAWDRPSARHPLLILEIKTGFVESNLHEAIAQCKRRAFLMPEDVAALTPFVAAKADLRAQPELTDPIAFEKYHACRLEIEELRNLPKPGLYIMDLSFGNGLDQSLRVEIERVRETWRRH